MCVCVRASMFFTYIYLCVSKFAVRRSQHFPHLPQADVAVTILVELFEGIQIHVFRLSAFLAARHVVDRVVHEVRPPSSTVQVKVSRLRPPGKSSCVAMSSRALMVDLDPVCLGSCDWCDF